MTLRELDRLVSKTELDNNAKFALRGVRKAVLNGRCGNAEIGETSWSISMDTFEGQPIRMRFSFRRE